MNLPRPLSHSSISMYGECPLKYKLKYVDGIPEKPKHFFSFGQSVHKALEFFYKVEALPAPSLEELLKNYRENWVTLGYRDQAQEAEYFQQGKDILAGYHRRHAAAFRIPYSVEYDFQFTVDGVPVTGKVDRIDRQEDGRFCVVDYKTGKALTAGRVAQDAQLTMYQLACESLLGAEVARLTFYHLPTHHEHSVGRRSQEQLEELRARIKRTAEAIIAERFEAKPSENSCRWCDFKAHCPVFSSAPAPVPAADELAALIDKFGELTARRAELDGETAGVKAALLDILRRKGYVRAFGARFEVQRCGAEKFEFSEANKKKVLHLIKAAGLYESVLAPSAPLIQKLLADPGADAELRAALRALGVPVEASDLKVTPL